MDEEKNVLLRIVQDERDDELSVDFSLIGHHFKRLLALWLCLAVALGALSAAAALYLRGNVLEGDTKALVHLASPSYDIAKIKSPNVIADALNAAQIDAAALESIRNAIEIGGVIAESDYERLSMYYAIVTQDAANVNAVQSLLNTNYSVSEYIVTFHSSQAGMSKRAGLDFLNALLRSYQDYCALNYNDNTALSNPLSANDYREYDYAEAANIFRTALDNISSYLIQLSENRMGDSFRSVETGFTFSDLSKRAASLKDIDLDRITSYIVIHSVSANPPEVQISYYEWLIENLTRQRAIERTRLNSLTDSISKYEKDSMVILTNTDGASSVAPGTSDINATYDAMIQQKLEAQATIASYNRSISYYESVIEGFQKVDGVSNPKDVELVQSYLESLNDQLTELTRNVTVTANEYYEKASFSNQVQILVPAVFDSVSSSLLIKYVVVIEAALFAAYAAVAVFLGIRDANPRKKEEVLEGQPEQEPVPLAES